MTTWTCDREQILSKCHNEHEHVDNCLSTFTDQHNHMNHQVCVVGSDMGQEAWVAVMPSKGSLAHGKRPMNATHCMHHMHTRLRAQSLTSGNMLLRSLIQWLAPHYQMHYRFICNEHPCMFNHSPYPPHVNTPTKTPSQMMCVSIWRAQTTH